MTWRSKFDAAETQAVAAFEAALGPYRGVAAIPFEDYRNQRAGREVRAAHSEAWIVEQQKRAASAWPARNGRVDVAEAELRRDTLATLKAFFRSELRQAGS
jgi:hypothetical protein